MPLDIEQASAVARTLGLDEHELKIEAVPGGDIAEASLLRAADATVFVKALPLEQAGLLSAEDDGLKALDDTGEVRVPKVIRRGMHDGFAWLALEYLELDQRSPRADERLGRQLAAMHRHTGDEFGWHRSNYIGRTPQTNTTVDEWTVFFAAHRLGAQFDRLRRNQPDSGWNDLKNEVIDAWMRVSDAHEPAPSLIHGDLWRGNAAALSEDVPVIYDPSVHYADRECDLAMAHLFGGFDESFYQAYEAAWPLPEGFETRRFFYKLYHMLNHANLFGGPYIEASEQLCRRILQP
ncbi:fructosamine kinase family protein [Wenzhouxiangella sp. EGI_FJ10305]|uniref:fructosamine kinase family protein n=1 Tax=Wenzhouxiangella sp. EGI_FJ10305 TaxID=3243768 RepID=UPI0035DFEBA1